MYSPLSNSLLLPVFLLYNSFLVTWRISNTDYSFSIKCDIFRTINHIASTGRPFKELHVARRRLCIQSHSPLWEVFPKSHLHHPIGATMGGRLLCTLSSSFWGEIVRVELESAVRSRGRVRMKFELVRDGNFGSKQIYIWKLCCYIFGIGVIQSLEIQY